MITKFINRVSEIDFLESKYHDPSLQVIILYGRRRVGKSSLIQQFIKNKRSIYYLASRTVQDLQISDFIDTIKRELNDEQIDNIIETIKIYTP